MAATPDGDSAVLTVTAPATGRPWQLYSLTLCTGTEMAAGCPTLACNATGAVTECPLEGLEASTDYQATVVAEKTGAGGQSIASPASSVASFQTPPHE